MSGPGGLERRYRRLVGWYPRRFRDEYGEEMVAVMMAGASPNQDRPGAGESANVLRGAVWARLRPPGPPAPDSPSRDALALFSVLAPVFLAVVAVPFGFRLPASPIPWLSHREIQVAGWTLLARPGFAVAAGTLVLPAAAAVLGMRRLALAAGLAVLYAVALRYATSDGYGLPMPLEMLATSGGILELAALAASPGPRRGRQLLRWKHVSVLLLAAAAVYASWIAVALAWSPGLARLIGPQAATTAPYLVAAALLIAAAAGLAVAFWLDRRLLALLAGMLYPWALQVAATAAGGPDLWVAAPATLASLAYLYLPPLLLACAVAARAAQSRHNRPQPA